MTGVVVQIGALQNLYGGCLVSWKDHQQDIDRSAGPAGRRDGVWTFASSPNGVKLQSNRLYICFIRSQILVAESQPVMEPPKFITGLMYSLIYWRWNSDGLGMVGKHAAAVFEQFGYSASDGQLAFDALAAALDKDGGQWSPPPPSSFCLF